MNFLFHIAQFYIPEQRKKKEFMELFEATAAAFEKTTPSTDGLSFEGCLREFARFTNSVVDQATTKHEDLQTIQELLYQSAYEFGAKFKRRFGVSTPRDVMAASRFLYHLLGIDFKGTEQGMVTISKCFFSQYLFPCHL